MANMLVSDRVRLGREYHYVVVTVWEKMFSLTRNVTMWEKIWWYLTCISQMDQREDTGNATRLRMQRIYDPLSHLINTSILGVTGLLSFGCLATANNGSLAANILYQCLSSS